MSYLPYPTDVNGIAGLFQYADKVTCTIRTNSTTITNCATGGGFYNLFLLIGIFFFVFLATGIKYGNRPAFTAASFMTMMASILFYLANFGRADVIPITIIMFVASIFFLGREQ